MKLKRLTWLKKTWAERQGIPVVKFGDTVADVDVTEYSRISKWQFRKAGIQSLIETAKDHRRDGEMVVVAGVYYQGEPKYALFKQWT